MLMKTRAERGVLFKVSIFPYLLACFFLIMALWSSRISKKFNDALKCMFAVMWPGYAREMSA